MTASRTRPRVAVLLSLVCAVIGCLLVLAELAVLSLLLGIADEGDVSAWTSGWEQVIVFGPGGASVALAFGGIVAIVAGYRRVGGWLAVLAAAVLAIPPCVSLILSALAALQGQSEALTWGDAAFWLQLCIPCAPLMAASAFAFSASRSERASARPSGAGA